MSGGSAWKLLERMRRTKAGWSPSDFERLFEGFGFRWKEGKSHRIYWHPEFPDLMMSVPRHRELKNWVAKDAIKLVEEVIRRKGLEADNETEQEDD